MLSYGSARYQQETNTHSKICLGRLAGVAMIVDVGGRPLLRVQTLHEDKVLLNFVLCFLGLLAEYSKMG